MRNSPKNKTFGGSVEDKVIIVYYSAPTCVVGFLFQSLTRPFNCTAVTVDPLCVSYHAPPILDASPVLPCSVHSQSEKQI